MRRTSLLSLSVLTLTGAFLFTGCTVERSYEGYSDAQPMISQNFANMMQQGGDGYLAGRVGAVSVDNAATVDAYGQGYGDEYSSDLNSYDGSEWAMAGLWVEGASLNSLELGQAYTFSSTGYSDVTAGGIGCSDNGGGGDYFDEGFEEVTIVVEEGEEETDRVVMFTGEFPNGNEVEGGFSLTAE